MSARTDALASQSETGKIALRPSSLLRPVVTRRVPSITPETAESSQDESSRETRFSEIRHEHRSTQHEQDTDGDDEEQKPAHRYLAT
jgi:hypothetical protein